MAPHLYTGRNDYLYDNDKHRRGMPLRRKAVLWFLTLAVIFILIAHKLLWKTQGEVFPREVVNSMRSQVTGARAVRGSRTKAAQGFEATERNRKNRVSKRRQNVARASNSDSTIEYTKNRKNARGNAAEDLAAGAAGLQAGDKQ